MSAPTYSAEVVGWSFVFGFVAGSWLMAIFSMFVSRHYIRKAARLSSPPAHETDGGEG